MDKTPSEIKKSGPVRSRQVAGFDLIGFGAVNLDLIYRLKDLDVLKGHPDLSLGSESTATPAGFDSLWRQLETTGDLVSRSAGGSAANTAYALNRMGFRTGFVGKVGDDEQGGFLLNSFGGVDTSRISRGDTSGLCLSLLDEGGERALLALPNANSTLSYDQVDLDYLRAAKYVHLSSLRGDAPFEAQKEVVGRLDPKTRISFDPGHIYASKGLEQLAPLVEKSYIVFLSDDEAQVLTGMDWEKGCSYLLERGPEIVVCRLGAAGSKVFRTEGRWSVGPVKTEVVDKTGAGDVYAAGFIAGLLLEKPVLTCALIATEAASKSITGYGREAYPDQAFLVDLLKRLD